MMKKCSYCGKRLQDRQRKYCDGTCSVRFLSEGPAKEQWKYEETLPSLEILKKGAWLMFTRDQTDEQCRADFIRVWERPPEYVLWDPATPWWKFAGPVWDEEEMARRWQGA